MSFAADIAASDVIDGVRIVTPSVGRDARGTIWTSWDRSISDALLPDGPAWCHDKFSQSAEGVLRGIHGDTKSWKLVTCVAGEIFQVVADLREGSPSYLKWQGFRISPEDQRLVLIPPGCGNAYFVTRGPAVYHYKLAYEGGYIDADEQFTVAWDDPRLGIDWPSRDPILSPRDARVSHADD